MRHHTKDKGDLGVLKAQCDLYEQGYIVLSPMTEHAPFDLAIYKNGRFKSVQVKYRTVDKNGVIVVNLKTSWADKNGTHIKKYDKTKIDLICIYCPNTDECYYIDINSVSETVTLRVEPPRNNQKAGVKLAEDFRRVP